MIRSFLLIAVLGGAALGCTTSSSAERDAASTTGDSAVDAGVTSEDTGSPHDAALPDGAIIHEDAGPGSDAGPALIAHPPEGTSLCGEGTLTQEELRATCNTSDTDAFGVSIEKNCDALTTAGLDYEIWCSAEQLYVFARFREVDSPSRLNCPGSVPLPDGGMISFETHPLPFGISTPPPDGTPIRLMADGATTTDTTSRDTRVLWNERRIGEPFDASYERTVGPWPRPGGGMVSLDAGGALTFGITLTPVDCTGFTPTGPAGYVFVVGLGWTAP